jgi:hypothetical protein
MPTTLLQWSVFVLLIAVAVVVSSFIMRIFMWKLLDPEKVLKKVLGRTQPTEDERTRTKKQLIGAVVSHYKSNRLNWIPGSTSVD